MNSLQESAWLAGILEGEGCFRVQRKSLSPSSSSGTRDQLVVSLKMNDRDIVEAATDIMSAAGIVEDNPNTAPSVIARKAVTTTTIPWGTTYGVAWRGQKAENVMRRVYQYMGVRRKAKIDECLRTPNLSHHSRISATA